MRTDTTPSTVTMDRARLVFVIVGIILTMLFTLVGVIGVVQRTGTSSLGGRNGRHPVPTVIDQRVSSGRRR